MPLQINHNGTLIADSLHKFTLHSQEVSEILSDKPGFLVRWGTTVFLIVLVGVVAACWLIKYPDTVATKAKLTSINSPKEIKTKTDGHLIKLLVVEGKFVQPQTIIGWMESRADHTEVIALSKQVDTLQILLRKNTIENAINGF